MSGTAKSYLDVELRGIRVGKTIFTPEHSKNGVNVSAKLKIYAFANDGDKEGTRLELTAWGKLAHSAAKSMSQGKEFSCHASINVYDKRVFLPSGQANVPGELILKRDGTPLTIKQTSYTIKFGTLSYGAESNSQQQADLQAGERTAASFIPGSADEAQWREKLKARHANTQFNPALPQYGFAAVQLPKGDGIGAYQQKTAQAPAATTFQGVNPAAVPAAPAAPAAAPAQAAGFTMPANV